MARADRRPSHADVRRALRANRERLLSLPNVVRLAIGGKVVKGERRSTLAIRVHVRAKSRRERLGPSERIPRRLRGVHADWSLANFYVPTDVVKAEPRLRLLAFQGGNRILGGRTIPGMAALVYTSVSNRRLVLTNAHVAVGPDFEPVQIADSTEIFRPNSSVAVAAVHRLTPIKTGGITNRMDAALGRVYSGQPIASRSLLNQPFAVVDVEDVHGSSSHEYFYMGPDGARKEFIDPDEAEPELIDVGDSQARFSGFYTLRQKRGGGAPIARGDSGSLLVREGSSGLLAVAVVFAGGGRTLAVYPVSAALKALSRGNASPTGTEERVEIDFDK